MHHQPHAIIYPNNTAMTADKEIELLEKIVANQARLIELQRESIELLKKINAWCMRNATIYKNLGAG